MSASKASEPGQTRRVRKLRFRIGEADQLQALRRDPNLIAVETERGRRRTLAGLWLFLALGLVFTTAGVQRFLAGNTTPVDPLWWAAWTVEPMFAGLLIVLLNFEATILIHGIDPDSQALVRLKRILLGSTMFMNVVPQLAPLISDWAAFNPASAFVHAAIPAIVYYLAEVIPVIQARCRQVIHTAYQAADPAPTAVEPEPSEPTPTLDRPEPAVPEPAHTTPAREPLPPKQEPEPAERTAPAPQPLPAPQPVRTPSVRLPAAVLDKLARTRDQAVSEGREFTAADVQRAVRVSDDLADQLVHELTRTNGHALT